MDLQAGATVGQYRIESVRGRGGMGIVYETTHLALGVRRALKVIAPALADDPRFRERFKRESQLAASIEHPNVIAIHDSGESDGVLYIAMGFVDGIDLRDLVSREGALEPERAVKIVAQIASALDAAHAAGLVHRDVKPANVLIVDAGTRDHSLLTDFGVTKQMTSAAGLTNTGQWVGTADFVAPEQLDDRPTDGRSDVYALAGVLYYALAGKVPYPRENDVAKLYAQMHEPVPTLPRAGEEPWRSLDAVVQKGMAKSPDDRYQTTGDLARAAAQAVGTSEAVGAAGTAAAAALGTAAARGDETIAGEPRTMGGVYGQPPPTPPPPSTPPPAATPPPAPPPPQFAPGDGGGPYGRPTRRRGPPVAALVGGGVLAVAVLVIALFALGVFGGSDDEASAEPIKVGNGAEAVEVDDGSVWVANVNDGTVSRIDADSHDVQARAIRVGKDPAAFAFSDEDVWVANSGDGTVSRIDKTTNEVVATIKVGGNPDGVRVGDGAIWVHPYSTEIVAIDPETNRVVEDSRLTFEEGIDIQLGPSGYWTLEHRNKKVSPYDVENDEYPSGPIDVPGDPVNVLPLEGAVFVYHRDGTMTHVDPETKRVVGQRFPIGDGSSWVDVGRGSLWVTFPTEGVVKRFDLQTHEPVGEPIDVGRGVAAASPDDEDTLWVTSSDRDTVTPFPVSDLGPAQVAEPEIDDALPERFDPQAAEAALADDLNGLENIDNSVVDCPDDADPAEGDTINCTARIQDAGDPARGQLRVRVRNNAGSELAYRGKLRGSNFVTTVRGTATVE